jgi:hypothetical protein
MGDKVMKQIFIFSDSQKDNISYFEREPAMLVSMNRSDLPYLKEQDFASHTAIYVLIGGNKRYVGNLQAKPFINGYINTFLKKIRNGLSQFYFSPEQMENYQKLIPIIWRSDSFKISLRNQITK